MTKPKIVTEVVDKIPARFAELIKELGGDAKFIRKTLTAGEKGWELDEDERAEVGFVSTGGIDRDAEILVPAGADLSQFHKAPQVLWGHNYDEPPIGKALWTKKEPKKNPRGILAKTVYAQTARAEEIWQLVKGGFLKTFSVGFIPTKTTWNGADDYDKICDKLHEQGMSFDRSKVRLIYLKWILLEYSKVSVPANIEALTVAVSKGLNLSKDLCDELGICNAKAKYMCECLECGHKLETDKHCVDLACPKCGGEMRRAERPGDGRGLESAKTVIAFKDTGIAPESTEWDAGKEVGESDVDGLLVMSTWFDKENADVKSAYKLQHHRATGRHAAIWRGVAAAMGALLGSRGGVDVPAADRKGVYNHLVKHYKQFDKEPPEFKKYVEAELKIVFADHYDDILYLIHPALKTADSEHTARLREPDGYDVVLRQANKYGDGIHAIIGIIGGKSELHALRFDASKFTPSQARKFCRDNEHEFKLFEPAVQTKEDELRELNAQVELIAQPESIEKIAEPEPVVQVELVQSVKEKKTTLVEMVTKVERPIVELVKEELGRQLGKV